MKKLIIVESPSKAKKLQSYLDPNEYTILASKGHMTQLANSGYCNIGVDIEKNFTTRYSLMPDKVSLLNEIIQETKNADMILIGSDPDREGEAIGYQIAERIKDYDKPIKRIRFNEIKKDKILKAVSSPEEIDMKIVDSQKSRQVLDKIIGFMVSPFLMNFMGNNLSAGRTQSVVTRLIIDREREIENFKPETFFTINVNLSNDKINFFTAKFIDKLTDETIAKDTKDKLQDQYVVLDVVSPDQAVNPPAPMITSSLQMEMSKSFSISAENTMAAAQKLYEYGYISYPRTDSVRASDESIGELRNYISTKYALPKKPNVFKNKDAAQDAHECIRPTDISILPNSSQIIDKDELAVYNTIWKYFVASQMEPAIYSTLKVTLAPVSNKKLKVRASGKTLKSKGFLEILGISDDSKIEIPNLNKDDVLDLFGKNPVRLDKKQTQAPPRYSESKLIKELTVKGIGRPATYADLLSKICTRNYVEKKGDVYHATELGKKITDILVNFFTFMNYDYTAKMESDLDQIESGKKTYLEMLNSFYPKFKEELDKAYIQYGSTICERCKSPIVKRINKETNEEFSICSNNKICKYIIERKS